MLNIIEINDFHCSELDIYARYTEAQLLNKIIRKTEYSLQKVPK